MAQVADIKSRFQTIANGITTIETFMFDAFSMLNSTRDKVYPVFLLKVPEKSQRPSIYNDWKNYDIEFFVLDTHKTADVRTREGVWDAMDTIAEQVIIELKSTPNVYRISEVAFDYGYDLLNDKLVGVKCSMTLSVFHCYEAFDGGVPSYLLIDGTDYLLIDSTDKLIIQ